MSASAICETKLPGCAVSASLEITGCDPIKVCRPCYDRVLAQATFQDRAVIRRDTRALVENA